MKTAVSIPDDVFRKADYLVRRMKKSRSELFSNALSEYLASYGPDKVTNAMDEVCEDIGAEENTFAAAAARRVLKNAEW
ncbi:MAG TPA: hypothetical protein VGC60_14285 [Pyrinomonadaceae bacterium]|jgi:predicted transcriptional regulator